MWGKGRVLQPLRIDLRVWLEVSKECIPHKSQGLYKQIERLSFLWSRDIQFIAVFLFMDTRDWRTTVGRSPKPRDWRPVCPRPTEKECDLCCKDNRLRTWRSRARHVGGLSISVVLVGSFLFSSVVFEPCPFPSCVGCHTCLFFSLVLFLLTCWVPEQSFSLSQCQRLQVTFGVN